MEKVFRSDLVSIVVPIYNVEEYLERCLDSIINQTYSNIEIILVNDGSLDNSINICRKYKKNDKRIVIVDKENGGLSDARNAGIKIAKGKYITFIDSDDYVSLDYIEILYKNIIYHNSDISIGSHMVVYNSSKKIDKSTGDDYCSDSYNILYKILYDKNIDLSAWAKLYKTSLFNDIDYPMGRLYEDAATTYKLVDKSKKISVISKPIYFYMIRSNSITNNVFSLKKMDLIKSTKGMTDFVRENYPELTLGCDRRLMYAYLSTYTQAIKSTNVDKEILSELKKYIKNNRKRVLKDNNIPIRDRIALVSTFLGFKVYKILWSIYSRITGRY